MGNTLLFLCTGNYYRSRFAEIYFNFLASREGLGWSAISRGLAVERGVNNVGPMARLAIQALQAQGVPVDPTERFPLPVRVGDLESARRIIAMQESEHRPLIAERFPSWIECVEYWDIADQETAIALIEKEVRLLVSRFVEQSV